MHLHRIAQRVRNCLFHSWHRMQSIDLLKYGNRSVRCAVAVISLAWGLSFGLARISAELRNDSVRDLNRWANTFHVALLHWHEIDWIINWNSIWFAKNESHGCVCQSWDNCSFHCVHVRACVTHLAFDTERDSRKKKTFQFASTKQLKIDAKTKS